MTFPSTFPLAGRNPEPLPTHGATALDPSAAPRSRRAAPDLPEWTLARLRGGLVEISGAAASGALSSAMALVAEAQSADGEEGFIAWVGTTRSLFFPPDAVEAGVDLDRLVLLRLETLADQIRAATHIAQSGAFGLVVVDLVDSATAPLSVAARRGASSPRQAPVPPLSRLSGLARKHSSALVLLTGKPAQAASIDPRVVQRYDARRRGSELVITVIKDKARSAGPSPSPRRDRTVSGLSALPPGSRFERRCREPAGMC